MKIRTRSIPLIATVVVFVLLYAAASVKFPAFHTGGVFLNLLRDNAFLGVTAIGMTFVIVSGGIDLSVGAMVGFTSISMGVLMEKHHLPFLVVTLAVLAFGTLMGAGMGAIVAYFSLPPFMVTLAGMFLLRGLALLITEDTVTITNPLVNQLSGWQYAAPLVWLVVLLLGLYLAQARPFGRNVYAVGGSEPSAVLMGLPVASTKVWVYALSGFCSALAGVVYTVSLASGDPTAGNLLELDAIACVVIGGTLLSGGVGSLIGTVFGVLVYGVIRTAINFDGTLNSWWARIAIGVLLLLFILLQKVVQARAAKTQ